MKFEKNDPRLTAYVLNELSSAERAEIEKALQNSAELRSEVDALKKTLGVLQSSEKHDDAFFSLTDKQRDKLFAQTMNAETSWFQKFVKGPWGYATVGLVTASFALMIYSNHSINESLSKREQIRDEIQMAKDQMMEGGDSAGGPSSAPKAPTPEPVAVADAAQPPAELDAAAADEALSEAAPQAEPEKEMLADKKAEVAAVESAPTKPFLAKKAMPRMEQEMKKKDMQQDSTGLLSAFGSGGNRHLEKSYSGSGQALGMAAKGSRGFTQRQLSIESAPEIDPQIKTSFESSFLNCINDASLNETIEFKWDNKNGISEIHPEKALTSEKIKCLSEIIQARLSGKSNTFVFKLNSGSK